MFERETDAVCFKISLLYSVLIAIIGCYIIIEGYTGIACILIIILYQRRVEKLKRKIAETAKGIIKYPSLFDMLDSFMILEFASLVWGWFLLIYYTYIHFNTFSFLDGLRASLLFSFLCFFMLVMIQQIYISFLFTASIGNGFFLFSILPRFVSATRTVCTTFFWIVALNHFEFYSPLLLEIAYIIFKGCFFIYWIYEATALLTSKDFPEEFKTNECTQPFQCPVCLENVKFYITLPCSHSFCLTCFLRWGAQVLNCPMCRHKFTSWIHQVDFTPYNWLPFVIF
ncbi:hypothetical protein TVAG_267390 [Trichomonas vaginalis G3]|uniref:RING-type domain-containing protein n=1 Tax=Trichomonas vaginalis (strain ATCC PRA-98 / G3) TaxID=412133 RepID=A2F577_TRIV3|nr:RING finger protein 141-related family [Trichomonas vaginalis G3]EAX99970.1 hypothetical protein TVAG_267390 [Trichomonas vaginalis G3]KAI5516741.1 RING finger protein 141-related family [Trichomonas vaginalis G3]|eukprot:XP_001312900.1 hypothetical protein [Trichomonas vaginalis G3]